MKRCFAVAIAAAAVLAAPSAQAQAVKQFDVVARRFTFTPAQIDVNQGDTVRITVRSEDVKHGFAIEAFKVNEVIPAGGAPVTVEFVASQPGTFRFSCSEFCGSGHNGMNGVLVVRPAGGGQAPAGDIDPDEALNPAQPDFTLISLPTNLRLPRFKSAFRVAHRFTRPLGLGDFGDLAGDLFGLDGGAAIGLEYRFGIMRGMQIGLHRTSIDKATQFFLVRDIFQEGPKRPFALAALASIEGTNNFRDSYSPSLGVTISRQIGPWGAVYVQPTWVNNSNQSPKQLVKYNDTVFLGIGARLRFRPTVYLVVEGAPRVSGFKPGFDHVAVAIEKRVGGHSFQLNFSRSLATTPAQLARGGYDDWYMGFNITRKFY